MIKRKNSKKLGEMFVEKKLLSQTTVDRTLKQAVNLKRRFGEVLEDLSLITGEELASALAAQYGIKTINHLEKVPIDAKLLKMIPVELALRHMVFPLKKDGERLALAMIDPTDKMAMVEVERLTKLNVVPYVATKEEVRAEISRHYLNKEPQRPTIRTILIVDDDKLIRTMLKDCLEKQGYRVLMAVDGMEAFKIVIAESPHVVISDMEMPKFNGYNFFSAMTAIPELRHVPVILITGNTEDSKLEPTAFDKGFFDVIFKPISEATIQSRVKRAFHFYEHQYRLY